MVAESSISTAKAGHNLPADKNCPTVWGDFAGGPGGSRQQWTEFAGGPNGAQLAKICQRPGQIWIDLISQQNWVDFHVPAKTRSILISQQKNGFYFCPKRILYTQAKNRSNLKIDPILLGQVSFLLRLTQFCWDTPV